MKYGVNDISEIECSTRIGKKKHKASFPNAWLAFQAINVWYKDFSSRDGKIEMFYEITLSVNGDTIGTISKMTDDYYSYPEFVAKIRDTLRDRGMLSEPPLNRLTDVHIDWNKTFPSVFVRRKLPLSKKSAFRIIEYSILENKESSCSYVNLVNLVDGYDWKLDFEGNKGQHHYYFGGLDSIHRDLMRTANGSFVAIDKPILVSQEDALVGLHALYSRFPEWLTKLTNFELSRIVNLTLPGNNVKIQQEASRVLDLLPYRLAKRHIQSAVEQVEGWLEAMDIYADTPVPLLDLLSDYKGHGGKEHQSRKIVKIDIIDNSEDKSGGII